MSFRSDQLFDLTGKTAIVTGGAGLLGRRFCAGLAAFGARVVVVDIHEESIDQLVSELDTTYGTESLGIVCDVSQEAAVVRMVGEVVAKTGQVDILLNNAATKTDDLEAFFANNEEYALETWRKIMAVNIDGMFLLARTVGKQMLQQATGGSIIQTSSIYGMLGPDERIYSGSSYEGRPITSPAAYSTSKAAIIGLTRDLAARWGSRGIRVNALVPGGVDTGQNETFKEKYSARVPMGRMAHADEMIGAVVYLGSQASSYVTGQCLVVDGGLSAW